jgi:lambda family phage minor tail protein L
LSRLRTFARFLDAVNFAAGNAEADPTQELPRDVFIVERKSEENSVYIEWELRWPFDLQGVMLPGRVVAQGICVWQYQSAECSWVPHPGRYFDAADSPCSAGQDDCSHSLNGCKLRFGAKAVLPYGGFPGAGRVRQ